jgi:dihydroneopterin triphosphate diphosphatase
MMPDIRADGIAVYVYRQTPAGFEFLQIRRSASTGEFQHSWQTVYGGIERAADGTWKETAVQAALRELKEETGLVPQRLWQVEYLESFYFRPRDYVLFMPVFAAQVACPPRDPPIVLNDEHDDYRWIPEARIESAFMWRTQREALRYILDALQHGSAAMHFLEVPLSPQAPPSAV